MHLLFSYLYEQAYTYGKYYYYYKMHNIQALIDFTREDTTNLDI
uniref:Uncharacterized protein n=1 Tax=viral metagenome TaxID=1070528 RepID=A0A6C0LY50_9ZZZZ